MAKYAVKSATLNFGGTDYVIKSGLPTPEEICDAIDVTTLDNTHVQRIPGVVSDMGNLTLRLQGLLPTTSGAPAALKPGAVGPLNMKLIVAGGVVGAALSDNSVTVDAGDWTVVNCKPVEVEANNTREMAWEVEFACCGTKATTTSNSSTSNSSTSNTPT